MAAKNARGETWSKEETISLVNIFSSENIENDLECGGRYNMAIFSQVSKKLSEIGYDRDAKQCKRKMNKIKSEYHQFVSKRKRSGQGTLREPFWFSKIDELLSERAIVTPTKLFDSAGSSSIEDSSSSDKENTDSGQGQ